MKSIIPLVVCFFLVGCTPVVASPYPRPLIISLEAQQLLIDQLQDNDCKLPCFLDIRAGETEWPAARKYLEVFNEIRPASEKYKDGTTTVYVAQLGIVEADQYLPISTGIAVEDGVVQRINFNASGSSELLSKYWQKYSIKEVFNQLGRPEKAFFGVCPKYAHPCFEGLLIYEKQKIALKFFGENLPENNICPQLNKDGEISSIDFSIANPLSGLDTLPPDWITPEVKEYWTPIKDVLGIDENEFYERVLSDSPACFQVITTK
jgi:hypothetical protein